ncbi:MAG: DUF4329 domain-containing protein [Bacteroidota bacterium]
MKVTLPNGDLIEYMIDGQNRRIGKKLNGSIVKKWIYAGGLSPIAELDSAYNVTAEFVGSLMIKNCNTYQLIIDHLGSVRLVVDINSGAVVQQMEYDEFGNVLSDSNPDFQPFAYAGGLYDSQTKLVRFGERDYDASAGRWTCKDPIMFAGGETSLYGYVGNDPINWADPSGLKKKCYSSEQLAGAQAVNAINYQSIQEDREYAGFIIQNENGTYSYTTPIPLGEAGGNLQKPYGTVALYHTHGANTPGMNNENFSGADKIAAAELPGNSYLGTPQGVIKKFDPNTWITKNLQYPAENEGEVPCDCP